MSVLNKIRAALGRCLPFDTGNRQQPGYDSFPSVPIDAERQQATEVRPALSDDVQLKMEEKSPAQIKAEALQADYFRQMTIENTPLGFYDDRYDMDDFPGEIDPAPSEVAEQALLQHLREHPELRQNPVWTDWYVGVDETASDNELHVGSAARVPHGEDAVATSEAR